MKKLVFILILLFMLLALGQAAFAIDFSGTSQSPEAFGPSEAPDAFTAAVVFGLPDGEYNVYFNFADRAPVHSSYEFDITSQSGTIHVVREYSLIYSRADYLSGSPIFISGTFSDSSTSENGSRTATGTVTGQIMMFDSSAPDSSLTGKTLIILAHYVDSVEGIQAPEELSYYVLYLEPVDWYLGPSATKSESATPEVHATPSSDSFGGLFSTDTPSESHHTDAPYSGSAQEDHHHDDSSSSSSSKRSSRTASSDMPEASGPLQVAFGAVLVSVAAALSGIPTSVLGSGLGAITSSAGAGTSGVASGASGASGTFGMSGAASQGAAHSAGASASSAGAGTSASGASGGQASFNEFVSNAFSAIKDFFKALIENLRDMLTDEGRSYASGKMSDFFEDEE